MKTVSCSRMAILILLAFRDLHIPRFMKLFAALTDNQLSEAVIQNIVITAE